MVNRFPFHFLSSVDRHGPSHEAGGFDEITLPGVPIRVRKKADGAAVNNSVALVNDPELFFRIGPRSVWIVDFTLLIVTTITADWKENITVPAGATLHNMLNNMELGSINNMTGGYSKTGTAIPFNNVTNADSMAVIRAIIIAGATGGTVQLQWAQNTATVTDTKVLANSCLYAHKLN